MEMSKATLFALALLVFACHAFASRNLLCGPGTGSSMPFQQQQTAIHSTLPSKKGAGVWYSPAVVSVIKDLNVSWLYTWKATAVDEGILTPPGIEDVPLFWSILDVTPENLAKVAAEPSNYVMTFNEPDRLDQGTTKVSEALAAWPSLESLGKFLGAPATGTKTLESLWLDEFMHQAWDLGYRIDFMSIHYYIENTSLWEPDLAVQDMKEYLERIFIAYELPIWVTEFGMSIWYDTRIARHPSVEIQAEFLGKACEMMDGLDFVDRYAYFPTFPYTLHKSLAHMYEEDGSITPVGEVYKSAC